MCPFCDARGLSDKWEECYWNLESNNHQDFDLSAFWPIEFHTEHLKLRFASVLDITYHKKNIFYMLILKTTCDICDRFSQLEHQKKHLNLQFQMYITKKMSYMFSCVCFVSFCIASYL